ncbi:ethylene-responsive transcription factor-like protein At4g13040 isoform X1 [Cornus florida]|uniref:ethylene-responsive transcription factor-like protein At4g13040 isoform X1 n=2 Tax=Cornus florida TaxID=4283 RepID=UPI0028A099CA|nr:ethylene-responsive transcription factor-like protein At4g13040 isoform X1 [Cornus florida]XP_059660102.1 ethylene-responsive transcription factor-like protein At4g13040 isoform X1 [Cornus florida]XP_059660103.1 ethylene-responsive transcription factor-like protein At4g13040 isoform X1 [Cornus florida]
MVSIRRRKLLGLCSGRNSFLAPLSRFSDCANALENPVQNTKPGSVHAMNSVFVHQPKSVHPMPSVDADQPEEKTISKVVPGSSIISGSSSSKEQDNQLFPVKQVKRRKRHRRKNFENQEQCVMRGVYFKNMKWQAAIKVDKKQIHLGTVGSQEEAAHLYDRAAFMCGREPNFELSKEEKQELRKFNWEEFLAMTRYAITSKRHQRRSGEGSRRKSEFPTRNSEWDGEQEINGFSASEDVEPDILVS